MPEELAPVAKSLMILLASAFASVVDMLCCMTERIVSCVMCISYCNTVKA